MDYHKQNCDDNHCEDSQCSKEFNMLIEAYDSKVQQLFIHQLFIIERDLRNEFEEWLNEKNFQMAGDSPLTKQNKN